MQQEALDHEVAFSNGVTSHDQCTKHRLALLHIVAAVTCCSTAVTLLPVLLVINVANQNHFS